MIEYSLVVPVFNEEESLRLLYDEIVAVAETLSAKIELIFVADGSTVLRELLGGAGLRVFG